MITTKFRPQMMILFQANAKHDNSPLQEITIKTNREEVSKFRTRLIEITNVISIACNVG